MLLHSFVLALGCLLVTIRAEDNCRNWKYHKNFHLVHSEDDCGQAKAYREFRSRIFNGKTALPGSLPWMAYIVFESGNEYSKCGGSIINENYILSAAHCLDELYNPNITVELGAHNINNKNYVWSEKYNVTKYYIHPEYDPVSNINDVVLFRLDRSISFESPYINYICLPTTCETSNKTYLGESLKIAGWGLISNEKYATTLQTVMMPVKNCTIYRLGGKFHWPIRSQLCTGSGDVMACGGDSGGPLVYETAGRVVQVGILSFGPDTCSSRQATRYDFYSRVSSFMGWILDTMVA